MKLDQLNVEGTYILVLYLPTSAWISVGRLGEREFCSGFYYYIGSAFGGGGLKARLNHHLNPVTRPHWHIDYLRTSAHVVGIWTSSHNDHLECSLSGFVGKSSKYEQIKGFGASDCKCTSHLFFSSVKPNLQRFIRDVIGTDENDAFNNLSKIEIDGIDVLL